MNTLDNIERVSASQRKLITSLRQGKHRRALSLFVAEGDKCVGELLSQFTPRMIVATPNWLLTHDIDYSLMPIVYQATKADMERITAFASAPEVVAVMECRRGAYNPHIPTDSLVVALDGVQDPGNMGTIIRACDWFGVKQIIASADTVDCYNPKVVQATMGALGRVNVAYTNLPEMLSALPAELPVYGTFLDGDNIYSTELSTSGIIVMGNEGKGISAAVAELVNRRLFIPPYPIAATHVESLNVAMATAITLSTFRQWQSNR